VIPERAAQWAAEAVGRGARIVSARRLRLGGWHVNHALDVADRDERLHRLVLRRWARAGWERDDPDYTAEREARILERLRRTPVLAPVLVAADPDGVRCDVPALLLTRLAGSPPRDVPYCGQLAAALAQIHALDPAGLERYRLYFDRARARLPHWIPDTPVVRRPPPTGAPAFIHRDYHPENTLWSGGRLSGVVDWTQASSGPPGLDVGHMRWNLVAGHGVQAADRFLACYRAAGGRALADQPYWDLTSLFDLLLAGDDPGDITPADLRRFEAYVRSLGR
jgi:aminoglycoside phosphotransferase (APT) family kinase protein